MKSRLHYSWIVCIGCTIAMFCCTGLVINAFSVYMPYLVERYQLTQTQASMVTTFRSLFSLIFKFVVIWFINRLNVRRTMTLGFLCTTLAFVCYSFNGSPIWIYIAASLSGMGYGLATMVPISILLNRWFKEKLAMAVAVCAASTGVASMIFPTIITKVVQTAGLSSAFLIEAAVIFVLCVLAVFLLRNEPQEKGLRPFGDQGEESEQTEQTILTDEPDVLSKGQRIFFMLAPLMLGAVTQTAPGLFTLHFTGEGFDPMKAALAVSVFGFSLLVGKFAYGYCTDAIGGSKTNYLFLTIQLLGVALGCFIRNHPAVMFASVVLIGLGFSVSTVGITMWAKEFSTAKEYGNTVRLYQILFMIGSLILSPCTGIVADAFGSYVPVFAMYTVMTVGILLVILWAYRAKRGRQRKLEAVPSHS